MALAISAQGSPNSAFFAGIGSERLPQLVFFGGLLGHERFVLQAGVIAADGLERIFHAEKIFVRDLLVFRGFGAEFLEHRVAARQRIENQGIGDVAEQVELRHGVQPARGSGIAGNKDEVAVFDAGGGPLEVVVEMRGLIVLVDAEEADVQIVARDTRNCRGRRRKRRHRIRAQRPGAHQCTSCICKGGTSRRSRA